MKSTARSLLLGLACVLPVSCASKEGMEMLRIFWDGAVALDPAIEPRDEKHMPLCAPGQLAALWKEAGLVDVIEQPLTIRMEFASFDDYWRPFLAGQGPAGAHVGSLPEARRRELEGRLRRRLLGDRADGRISLAARAWAVRGRVARH